MKKIMYLAPYFIPLNNEGYGGIERTISRLDKEFSEKEGWESLVFAPKDSKVYGELVNSNYGRDWYFGEMDKRNPEASNQKRKFEDYCKNAVHEIVNKKPDLVHDFIGLVNTDEFKSFSGELPPVLSTLHNSANQLKNLKYGDAKKDNSNKEIYFNAISNSQKKYFERIMDVDFMVPNSIEINNWDFANKGKGYVFAMGSIYPGKGFDLSVDVANHLRKKIIIAGPVHNFNKKTKIFWEEDLKPKIDVIEKNFDEKSDAENEKYLRSFRRSKKKNVVYLGEINESQKRFFLKNADAFYYPVEFEKDFPKVVAEANASGVPVVSFDRGGISEIIKHGETGYIVGKPMDLINFAEHAKKVEDLSRKACRENIANRFPVEKQINSYEKIYNKIIKESN